MPTMKRKRIAPGTTLVSDERIIDSYNRPTHMPDWAARRSAGQRQVTSPVSITFERVQVVEFIVYEKLCGATMNTTRELKERVTSTFTVQVLAGAIVQYLSKESKTICYVADCLDEDGRLVQLAFDRGSKSSSVGRITRYGTVVS